MGDTSGVEPGTVYLVGRRPGRSRADDPARARADRRRRRDPLRPPDPGRARSRAPAPTPSSSYVGKQPGAPSLMQSEINERLVELAQGGQDRRAAQGRRPVRLRPRRRGGRGAGRGGGAVRGRARRHRGRGRAGLRRDSRDAPGRRLRGRLRHGPRGPRQARARDRLGGARPLPRNARLLHGREEPAADRRASCAPRGARTTSPPRWSRSGTLPTQQAVLGTLDDIAARAEDAGLEAPAITVVGPAAGLRDTLAWLEQRPLYGQTVAVTRARAQASGLAARLAQLGANVVETPAIRIEPRAVEPGPDRLRPRLRDQPERRGAPHGRAARRTRPAPAPPSPQSGRAPPPS